jgi:hypothetical protein
MLKHFISNLRYKIITHANPLILIAGLLTASLSPIFVTTGIAHASITNTRLDSCGYQEVAQGGWLNNYGVFIDSNGPTSGDCTPITNNSVKNINGQSTTTGEEWQCVEMVNRLYLVFANDDPARFATLHSAH